MKPRCRSKKYAQEQQEHKKRVFTQAERRTYWKTYWQKQREQDAELRELNRRNPVRFVPAAYRRLEAWNEFLSGEAIFRKQDGVWSLGSCDPSLSFLKLLPFDQIKLDLLRRGMAWVWSPVIDRDKSSAGRSDMSSGKDSKNTAHERLTALGRPPTAGDGVDREESRHFTGCTPATLALQR